MKVRFTTEMYRMAHSKWQNQIGISLEKKKENSMRVTKLNQASILMYYFFGN